MGQRATDSKFNPVTVMLAFIAILIGALGTMYLLNYNSFEKNFNRALDYMEQDRQTDQAHLREFDQQKYVLDKIQKEQEIGQKELKAVRAEVQSIRKKQDIYWPPGEH